MRRFYAREARFSLRVLRAYAATGIAAALALRAAAEGVTEILLYDEISYWGITAKDFVLALAQAGDGPIHLRINSPGGDAFEGLAIYNALKARATPVTVTVDGIAASAASFVAMAGGTINMPEQAMLMLHDCWGVCVGNRNDMLEMATVQEKIDGMMAEIYAAKCGKSKADMAAVMDAETWYTSTEAKAAGLCDAILPSAPQNAMSGAKILARGNRIRAADPAYPDCDPENPDPENPNCDEMMDAQGRRRARAQLPPYDPDGDGDNDAEEALGMVNAAIVLLQEAAESLSGAPDDDEAAEGDGDGGGEATIPMPIVPGASAEAKSLALQVQVRLRRHRLAEAEAA